ncbi:MAG: RagB/SusD family nutrient uptake outer membrane protein [Chitinophagaceae bacterium]|nr:RagB/SusD family nutrient uptake outer membrane protein [Chitinophagaceae bacterium]
MKYSNYLYRSVSFILLLSFSIACKKNLLDKLPQDQVSSEIFFLHTNDLKIYMNQFYSDAIFPVLWGIILDNPYPGGADDFNSDNQISSNAADDRLKGTRTVYSAPSLGGWDYTNIRAINYFFDNYRKCEDDFNAYKQYVGEAHFFRAWLYFRLLQQFGNVPYISVVLGTDSPELYGPQTARNIVADNILADLDSAATYLPEEKTEGGTRLDKWSALLLLTRVALYEGAWEKYHNGDAFGASAADPDKYFNQVVTAATEMMNSGKLALYNTGNPATDYYDLFKMRDYSDSKEALLWKKFSVALDITNNRNYRLEYPFGRSLTKGLADAYLCTDGKPIAVSPLFGGFNTLSDEMKNRDPRFYQTIFTPSAAWKITNMTEPWQDAYVKLNSSSEFYAPTGYVLRKTYDPDMNNHSLNYEETPAIHFRYAEALLNFAEAKAELGTITQADLDRSIGLLRARAGMPALNMAAIATDPNWEFPGLSPLLNEIRRERRVELATEGFRWPDIARWAAADELIIGKRPKGFKGAQIASAFFPVDANGFLDPFRDALPAGYGFNPARDYLDPIPPNEIILNPKLVQNPGW